MYNHKVDTGNGVIEALQTPPPNPHAQVSVCSAGEALTLIKVSSL